MTTDLAPQQPSQKGTIRELIMQMKDQFALALPRHITPDRFMRVTLTAINKNPKLMQCTKESLLACLMDCSALGLEPDGRKAHLIPYNNRKNNTVVCTLIVDYKGMVDLARRSGDIADIHADVVGENDKFEYSFGTEGKLVHRPCLTGRGKVIAAYSFVKLKDGATSYEVMSKEEVEAIRKRSRAGDDGPWITDWNEMAKKSVFRRHSKWLPMSSEFQEALDKDFDIPTDIIDADGPRPIVSIRGKELPPPTTGPATTGQAPAQVPPSTSREGKDSPPPSDNAPQAKPAQDSAFKKNMDKVEASLTKSVGAKKAKEMILNTLGTFGYESIDMIPNEKIQAEFLNTLIAKYQELAASK